MSASCNVMVRGSRLTRKPVARTRRQNSSSSDAMIPGSKPRTAVNASERTNMSPPHDRISPAGRSHSVSMRAL